MNESVLDKIPTIPASEWTKTVVDKATDGLSFLFDPLKDFFEALMSIIETGLSSVPPIIFIPALAIIAFFIAGRRIGIVLFTILGLFFIYNQGLWSHFIDTTSLVFIASILAIVIGVPLGVLMSKNNVAAVIMKPVLDFMQTMPAFVYLIPAVAFFGIGMVPGIFASLIFATPPTVRFTNLGIRQVQPDLIEASEAFGSTSFQKLMKVELPMARATIMAGINQTVMLALSMVVVASMIGAPGLGNVVLSALQRSRVGPGFVAGIAIVILAIIIDRMTQRQKKES